MCITSLHLYKEHICKKYLHVCTYFQRKIIQFLEKKIKLAEYQKLNKKINLIIQ